MPKDMNSGKPILVTGSHRSGTTWVGSMLSASPSLAYIHEPFNIKWCRPGICGAKLPYWFTYITEDNEADYAEHIANTMAFRYDVVDELKALKTLRDSARMFRDYAKFAMYRYRNSRPLIKDPIALFSAGWLASKFNMDVVVLIRHPAAFAQSLKRKNWAFQFSNFLEQPLLMRDHLYPFEAEIRDYAREEHDIIDQAALLWKIIHHMIIKYQRDHNDWIFLRHEDLSRNPVSEFQALFKRLNVEFSESVKDVINKYSNSKNPIEPDANKTLKSEISRNSKAVITNWKNSLGTSEIERIRARVGDISQIFYSDEDW